MTCVIAYIDVNKNMHMAADSDGINVSQHHKDSRKTSKIFLKNDMIFGFTTSFRMGQILEYHLIIPKRNKKKSIMEYMVVDMIPAIKKTFKEHDYNDGGNFLITMESNIFEICSDFQVIQHSQNIASIGSGGKMALGSMGILEDLNLINIDDVKSSLEKTIEIVSFYNIAVSGRIDYLTISS